MIWATGSSLSCFCWLYRTSPSLATNIINLISVLTICCCPYVESSLVLLEEGVYSDQCIHLAKLSLPLTCFILYSKAKFYSHSRCILTSYFCIPVPYNEKAIFLIVSSRKSCRSPWKCQLQPFQHYSSGHRLGLLWYWMVCLGNEQII